MENNDLSFVTNEILERTDYLKSCVKESMTIGNTYVIKGIILFEEVLKIFNPIEMNDTVIQSIQMYISDIVQKREMIFNQYYMLGIKRCYFIIYDYDVIYKTKKLN